MGDYFRYFLTDDPPPTFAWLEGGFKTIDPRFVLRVDPAAPNVADLIRRDDVLAEIEINTLAEEIYQEDVADLLDQLNDPPEDAIDEVEQVRQLLKAARSMIALRVTDFGTVEYVRIDPIWDWLMKNRAGFLEVDDEGYYSADGVMLSLQ